MLEFGVLVGFASMATLWLMTERELRKTRELLEAQLDRMRFEVASINTDMTYLESFVQVDRS